MTRRTVIIGILVLGMALAATDVSVNRAAVFTPLFGSADRGATTGDWSIDPSVPHAASRRTLEKKVEGLTGVSVDNGYGSVVVEGTEATGVAVAVEYCLTVYADSQEQAEEYLDRLAVSAEAKEGRLALSLREDERPKFIRQVVVDYTLRAPGELALEVRNGFGQVAVRRTDGPVRVENRVGPVTMEDVAGDVEVKAVFGLVNIRNTRGNARVEAVQRLVGIVGVEGDLWVRGSFASVEARDIRGSVDAEMRGGQLRLQQVGGPVKIEAALAEVFVGDARSDLLVRNRGGGVRIELGDAPGGYTIRAEAEDGQVVTSLPLTAESFGRAHEVWSGAIGDGRRRVDIVVESGDIQLSRPAD